MQISDCFVEFKGFSPNYELASNLKVAIENIQAKAPSDSISKIFITKSGESYNVIYKIIGYAGEFQVTVDSPEIGVCISEMQNKMKLELKNWVKNRFAS